MINFTTARPLQEAVESISRRTPMGSVLSSAEWEVVPAEIRQRAMFSARVEDERLLAAMQAKLQQRIQLERSKLADGGEGVTMDRRRFIDETRMDLAKAGYRPDLKKAGGLQDLSSTGRLGLIWQMNLDQAQGYAQWKTAMDPDILAAVPAWEFVRLENRVERRAWPAIWQARGGQFFPGASEYSQGRMIALKTSDIWVAINRFGVPWKPFDWGSGLGVRNVRRKECIKLGLIKPGEVQAPLQKPFNAGAEASLRGIPASRRRAIEDSFHGDVEIEGEVIRLLPAQEAPEVFRLPALPPMLQAREADARQMLDNLTPEQKAAALQEISKTVAASRLAAMARTAGEPLDDDETLVRALSQHLAGEAGQSGVYAVRDGAVRDFLWSAADFISLGSLFTKWLGGGR